MGANNGLYILKPQDGKWRIWNRKMRYYWGNLYSIQPDELVAELNGQNRADVKTQLDKKFR